MVEAAAPSLDQLVTPEMRQLADQVEYKFALRAPGVFLGYQAKWAADESPVKVMEKSRRVGLSWAEAADAVTCAASTKGMDVWYIGYNKDMAIEFILDCAQWSAHLQAFASEIEIGEEVFKDGDEEKSVLTFGIKFASGNRITALSSRPSNLRGKQGRVILDEAAFHETLKELIKAAIALLMWGGQVRIISTHNGADNEFNTLIQDIRAEKVPYSLHRVTLDDALADGLYHRICMKLGRAWTAEGEQAWRAELVAFYRDDADEELFCIPTDSGGTYLTRAIIDARMTAPAELVLLLSLPKGFEMEPEDVRYGEVQDWIEAHVAPLLESLDGSQRSFFGFDFGRRSDMSVLTPLQQSQSLVLRPPFMIEMRLVPFKQQEQVLFYVVDRLPRFMAGALDATGNGMYLAEVAAQRYGSRIAQVMMNEPWYRANMPPFKAALQDGTLDGLPKDADVLADLRAFQVIKGVPKLPEIRTTDTAGGKRHGDAGVSLALGIFASRMDVVPVEFQQLGAQRVMAEMDDYVGGAGGSGRDTHGFM